jgi:CubicO group peptidase (beta-lactamase class C family)
MIGRRQFVAGSAAAALAASFRPLCAAPFDWQQAAPGDMGFGLDFGTKLDQFVQSGRVTNIHGVVIVRRGRLVLERYYEGDDQVRDGEGRWRVERVAFTAERSHEIRSVTKSIVDLLYGIAVRDGKVPPLDAPLLAQFPQYADLPDLERRRIWTIRHAITMTLGTDWNEDISYDDPRNGQTAMENAPDRARYVLEQPIVAAAGERWIYNGGTTVLIGRIIEKGVGTPIHDYARRVLFEPLGIGPTQWRALRDRPGETVFASGLAMRPRDLARIGQMVLDGGKFGERQIVPAAWLEDSFKPAARITDRRHYGYHWYAGHAPFDEGRQRARYVAAIGNGGQRLVVFPDLELVAVITAGNYNLRGVAPDDLFTEVILPSIR